jgi:hypothetical protein
MQDHERKHDTEIDIGRAVLDDGYLEASTPKIGRFRKPIS